MPRHAVQSPEWISTAPIQVTATVEIAAPPQVVWRHIADHVSWPTWFHDLDRVELLGEPTGVGGGRRVFVKRLPIDEEFTVWEEGEHFAFAVTRSKIPVLGTLAESVRLEPIDNGTRVTYRQGLSGRPGFGWAMKLAWRSAAEGLPKALGSLRSLIENEGN